jgi:hypothetical protein
MIFDIYQQDQIDQGYQNGLICEQVTVYAYDRFHWEQMLEIRLGFENGLSFEQVKLYTDDRLTWGHMMRIRRLLEKEPDGKSARLLVAGFNKVIF